MNQEKLKSGFITIIGRPNAGKSTFINQVLKQKVVITSDKPQTTRNQIQAIYNADDCQMIFIDTPGVHKPKHELGKVLNKTAFNALKEVDCILFMADASETFSTGNRYILDQLKEIDTPVILVLNKIDLLKKHQVIEAIETFSKEFDFADVVPISALTGENVETLITVIKDKLPEGPRYYPLDMVTDHPERFIIGELIREKVLMKTREEVPHSVAVVIDQYKKRDNSDIIDVYATIIVERPTQKAILIGKGGQMLKDIGTLARMDIENLLGSRIYLELWVKVMENWRNRNNVLNQLGYREEPK
ncbi:MAG: GTPase Era [Bacilli bacterium]|nr:GTPase Era [Bacilli bacterium]